MKRLLSVEGQVILLDDSDYENLNKYRWHSVLFRTSKTPYAVRYSTSGTILLHREIMGLGRSSNLWVDHIDRNTLNNQRDNLRYATAAQNAWCRGIYRNNKSGHTGISYEPTRRSSWRVTLFKNGRRIYNRYFLSLESACAARTLWEQEQFGEFAPQRELDIE